MRIAGTLLLAALASVAGPALAGDAGPGDAVAPKAAEEAATAQPPQPQSIEHKRKARMRCGCASPRLLRRGSEVRLGDGRTLTAWLRGDGEASLTYFTRPEGGGASTTVTPPVVQQVFAPPTAGTPIDTPLRLVRLFASAPSEPFYIGVEVPPRRIPGDVVLARVEGDAAAAPATGPPPELDELWVGALVDRQTATCGSVVSRRILTKAADDAAPIAAFLVEHTPAGGEPRTTLVDERHARIFGLGRVSPCEHGMPLDDGPGEISVRPVSETFGIGPAWRFSLPADPEALPVPLAVPDGKDLDVDDNPFLRAPRDPLEERMDDDADHAAFALMAFVLVGAATFAQIFYRARRKRKPHVVDTSCPACKAPLALDLNDPETDGMFCPKCGRSSVFVAFEADGTPKAKVILLEKDGRPEQSDPPA